MSKEQTLRKVVLCVSLIFGAMIGIPMRADRMEETLKAMNAIKVERVVHQENDSDKPLIANRRVRLCNQFLQGLGVRRARHPALGNNAGHIAVRRHVERGIADGSSFRRKMDAADMRHLRGGALLDRDLIARNRASDPASRSARRHRTARHSLSPEPRPNRCRSCSRRRHSPRSDRRRRQRNRSGPTCRKCPAMLSVIRVAEIPSCCNSQTVSREPCRKGRVSSAKTSIFLPASTAARITPSAVPNRRSPELPHCNASAPSCHPAQGPRHCGRWP